MENCETMISTQKSTGVESLEESRSESDSSVATSTTNLQSDENTIKNSRSANKKSNAEQLDGDGKDTQILNATQAKCADSNRRGRKDRKSVHRLEDQMNFEHLKKLQEIFHEADADGGGGLDIDEFREAMKRSMGGEVDDTELEIIFMKVDTNCDGTVDWDEYLSYMLMEYQEKDTMTSVIKQVPFPDKMKEMKSCHRDSVVRIAFLQHLTIRRGSVAVEYENPGRFLSLSKEGQLGVYTCHGSRVEFQRSITVDAGRESVVGPWLTDMVALANVGLVAISSTEREIAFYDIMTSTKFEKKFQITGFRDSILSMDYGFDSKNPNLCTLVAGDATGSVVVVQFQEALSGGLFGAYPTKGVVKRIPLASLLDNKIKGAFGITFEDVHSNWVNRVRYYSLAQGSECFISCSSSDNDSMYLGYLRNITSGQLLPGYTKTRGSYFEVRKGILAFDYCNDWNVIVTGGFDGIVRTWSPYSSKPGSLVKGHRSPVEHVTIVSSSGQVITLGRDRNIRIIDLRDHRTTQVLGPRDIIRCSPISQPIQTTFYHPKTKLFWLASIQVGVLEGHEDGIREDLLNIKSHDGPVSSVLYNHLFNQVVTGGQDSIVSVWDIGTGAKVIQFYTVKGVEITAMTFDPTGRRLITGSRNGAVKIWNFNNGACLRTLENETLFEVTGIVCLKQKIIVAGWSKVPSVYLDTKKAEKDEAHLWAKVHKEDILCLAQYYHSQGTAIVASGSYDGDIFIWSVDTGYVLCRLNRLEAFSPLSIEGHKLAPTLRRTAISNKARRSFSEQTGTSFDRLININSNTLRRHAVAAQGVKLPKIQSSGRKSDGDGVSVAAKSVLDIPKRTPSPTRIRTKSLRWKDDEAIQPSACSNRSTMTREQKTRHQVNIVTGKDEKNYWEADVSVDKIIFLQNRPHEPQTATLLAAGQMGWVYAWSVHPQGGLLGQFVGTHKDGDTVFSMATDSENTILVTGDTTGYVKIWDIDEYCCKKRRQDRINNLGPASFTTDEEEQKVLSARRMMKLNIIPPTLVFYLRAHTNSVTDITIIGEKKLFLTSCSDGTVRLWTLSGIFVGTFGQRQHWDLVNISATNKGPADVRRVASENTLKILRTGHSPWKLARNILNFVSLAARGASIDDDSIKGVDIEKFQSMYRNAISSSQEKTEDEIEKNYQRCLKSLRSSDVLGKSYKPKHRHRVLPKIEVKTHLSNFHVHSSIPFAQLEETCPIAVPGILQDKWRMQMALSSGQEKCRASRAASKGAKMAAFARRRGRRSQDYFAKHAKVVKSVKIAGLLTKEVHPDGNTT